MSKTTLSTDAHGERFSMGSQVWVRPGMEVGFTAELMGQQMPLKLEVLDIEELRGDCTCWSGHDYFCQARQRRAERHSQLVYIKGLEAPISGWFFTNINPAIKLWVWVTIIESNRRAQVIAVNPDCGEVSLLDYGRLPVKQVRV